MNFEPEYLLPKVANYIIRNNNYRGININGHGLLVVRTLTVSGSAIDIYDRDYSTSLYMSHETIFQGFLCWFFFSHKFLRR